MKKVLLIAALLLLCAGIQAQIVSSRSTSIKTEKSRTTSQWVLRAGLNLMNLAGDGVEGSNSNIGYSVMAGFQKPMGAEGAYWGMEAGLGSRGFKVEELKSIAHNIQFSPFTFGWKFEVADNFKIDTHLGAFASFDYTSKMKMDGESISWGDFADYEEVDYNHFDAGLNIGAGVWYGRYNLDFTYQRGFIDVFTDFDGIKTSNFLIRLGIAF